MFSKISNFSQILYFNENRHYYNNMAALQVIKVNTMSIYVAFLCPSISV